MLKLIVQKNLLIAGIVFIGDMLLSYFLKGSSNLVESLFIAAAVFVGFTAYDIYKAKNKG